MAAVAAVIASTDHPFHYRAIASPHGPARVRLLAAVPRRSNQSSS